MIGSRNQHEGNVSKLIDPTADLRRLAAPRVIVVMLALASLVLLAVVVTLLGTPLHAWAKIAPLATLNAGLNALANVLLMMGYRFIRQGRTRAHRNSMLAAFAVSMAFLTSYVIYHLRVGSVHYQGQGLLRVVYFSILVPHVILAAAMVPFVLLTLWRAWKRRFDRHRAVAKWTLPLWLFVGSSGVVVYLLLYRL